MSTTTKCELSESDLLNGSSLSELRICTGYYEGGPLDRVQKLVRLLPDENFSTPVVFAELLKFQQPNDDVWFEAARWIKYEETVLEDGRRWSKPHISLLSTPSLLRARFCLQRGTVLLDHHADSFLDVVDDVIDSWTEEGCIENIQDIAQLRQLFMLRKKHLIAPRRARELGKAIKQIISKSSTNESFEKSSKNQFEEKEVSSTNSSVSDEYEPKRAISDDRMTTNTDRSRTSSRPSSESEPNTDPSLSIDSTTETPTKNQAVSEYLLKKLPEGTEGAAIFAAKVDKLQKSAFAFVRLSEPLRADQLLEVSIPIRFLIFIATPISDHEVHESALDLGRTFGVLLTDEVYRTVAFRAKELYDLSHGVDELLSSSLVIPPGKWNQFQELEPPDRVDNQDHRRALMSMQENKPDDDNRHSSVSPGLIRTGSLFGGLVADIRRKLPYFASDFTDALKLRNINQTIATSLFLYLALLTNIVTFGALMSTQLHGQMGVIETLLSGLICGAIFSLFAGQPLNILSATGPVLIFEHILYNICLSNDWDFLATRWWLGAWTFLILILIVAFDLSALVALITRFTEECFATLISVLFIIQAFESLLHIATEAPLTTNPEKLLNSPCTCQWDGNSESNIAYRFGQQNFTKTCLATRNGTLTGDQCHFKPDVFLFSLLLFFGTFLLIFLLKMIKTSRFFTTTVREAISNFSSVIAIVLLSVVAHIVGLDLPTLHVPTELKPTSAARDWIVQPIGKIPPWVCAATLIPAMLFSILIFMDQHITAVIVNRKDNKLKKGFGYHLDMLILSITIMVCATLGIPFFVAATVLSISHVNSLRRESTVAAPGERPTFLGTNEQRVTGLLAALLIGATVFLAPIIRLIPTAVLFGVFLHMGYASLQGQQLVDRILLFLMPTKYQPDYPFLRLVRLRRVHLFTFIQLACLGLLLVVKNIKIIALAFPLMLLVITAARKLLELIFTKKELDALDDEVPTWRQLNSRSSSKVQPDTEPATLGMYHYEEKIAH